MDKLTKINSNNHDNDNSHELVRPATKQSSSNNKKNSKEKPLKITYISSPTLVRATTASKFRALVQELTGKNSRLGEEDDDDYYFEGNRTPQPPAEDGHLFPNGGSDVTAMEEGGFPQWRGVNGGIHYYSSNYSFV